MKDERILLVEDNADDADLTIDALRRSRLPHDVIVARDGAEALDYFDGTGSYAPLGPQPLPALVILDLNLPRVGGLEVLRRLRAHERTRLQPVVVLTTSVEDRDVIESYRLGANGYVRKPVAFEEFVDAAARLGLFWLTLNVRAPSGAA